jgi:tetratricopeptide (TPR) repeat protein
MSHSIRLGVGRNWNCWVMSLSLGLAVATASLAPQASFSAEEKQQAISRVIAKEMTQAQKDLAAQKWADAIVNLDAALTKSPLTAFDKNKIYDFKGFANVKLNKFKDAQEAYEQALATGAYSAEEAAKTQRLLFRLAASNQQYAKAIEFGKQAVDSNTATTDDVAVMAQLYYLQKDCKDSAIWADKAVAAERKANEAPHENLYQFKLQCASDAGDTPGMIASLTDLIRLTNKIQYWNSLLRIERQDERDDHNLLMIYRVMFNTNAMNAGSDYIEMAQLLGDAALPAEAAAVLDKATQAGLIKDEQKERTGRLSASFKTRADADKKGLPQLDAESQKNPAGELDVKLGEVYYGNGDYQNAVTAINRGIQKGKVKHLDEAYVYLGLSQARLNNTADAKKAFDQLKTVPDISPRVLKIWALYSEKLGSPLVGATTTQG